MPDLPSAQAIIPCRYVVGGLDCPDMTWAEPLYSRRAVNRAGWAYVDLATSPEDRETARAVINNWRSSHAFPLNTLQMNLRKAAARVDSDPTVAQRIKRLPSIRHKLERFSNLDLSTMQDLGGARAVVSSVGAVYQVAEYYRHESQIKHKLVRDDPYIDDPKASGYRGVHLVYRYTGKEQYNGLKIELQVRSRLQHAWATAVEIVGTFTRQALKSSWGDEDWLRFFALMSSAHALREDTPVVPGTPAKPSDLRRELRSYVQKLRVAEKLTAYGAAVDAAQQLDQRKGSTFLLELGLEPLGLIVRTYTNPAVAAIEYAAVEAAIEGDPTKDAVLVGVDSLSSLRRAYPNYFLDTTAFIASVEEAIE